MQHGFNGNSIWPRCGPSHCQEDPLELILKVLFFCLVLIADRIFTGNIPAVNKFCVIEIFTI
jgi:hypothetical protein